MNKDLTQKRSIITIVQLLTYTSTKKGFNQYTENADEQCFRWWLLYHKSNEPHHDNRLSVLMKMQYKHINAGLSSTVNYETRSMFADMNNVYHVVTVIVAKRNCNSWKTEKVIE